MPLDTPLLIQPVMVMKEYSRVPKTCPFCKQNPLVKIQELSDRIDHAEYIRHFHCPNCGKKVELRMLEYFHPDNGFQRNVTVRKIMKQEDNEIKRKQRIISIYSNRTTQ
jgi:transcription elongation factor Elf1